MILPLALATLLGAAPSAAAAHWQAMQSPWWENYDSQINFLCPGQGSLVLERNRSQASILTAGQRSTLFRDPLEGDAIAYRNGDLRLTLQGDELTLELGSRRITCLRSEQA
ncbi:MAG: hypothetical protein ACKOAP_03075 [Vulcanococcus sp.]